MAVDSKQIIRRVADEVYSKGNLAVVDELFSNKYQGHDPLFGETNPKQFKEAVEALRHAFPDLKVQTLETWAEGETCISHYRVTGTHKGEFMGVPGSNRKFNIEGSSISLVRNGRIERGWLFYDTLGLMQQIGVVPQLGKAKAGEAPRARR